MPLADSVLNIVSALERPEVLTHIHFGLPYVTTAHYDIYNTILGNVLSLPRICLKDLDPQIQSILKHSFSKNPFDEYIELITQYSDLERHDTPRHSLDAGLGSVIACRSVYTSALKDDYVSLGKTLRHTVKLGEDIALTTVGCVPRAWNNKTSPEVIAGLAHAYVSLIRVSTFSEVSSVALSLLAETVEKHMAITKQTSNPVSGNYGGSSFNFGIPSSLKEIEVRVDSPSFSNARIRISGGSSLSTELTFLAEETSQPDRSYLKPWGSLISMSGRAHNVCLASL